VLRDRTTASRASQQRIYLQKNAVEKLRLLGCANGVVWFILVDEAALLAQRAWFNRILFI
jgi:hypothetical protein